MRTDTTPEAEALRIEALRRLEGPSRLAQALEMSEAVREIALAGRLSRSFSEGSGSPMQKGHAS